MAAAAEAPVHQNYIFIDDMPEAAAARSEVRVNAEAILEARRQGVSQAAGEAQLIPIDALSTARSVHEAAGMYGEHSEQYKERLAALDLDCQRLVAEWYRKLRPEYFPKVRHSFDPRTLEFFSHGFSVRQMTENALMPIPDDPEEQTRRINERVEDATPTLLRGLGGTALNGMVIRTISECKDKAEADYAEDVRHKNAHRGYGGYVPEIAKLIVRDIGQDETNGDRLIEQVALPGIYITHSIIQIALERRGLEAGHLDKTGLHAAQVLAGDDLMEFVELLDTVAGEQWATNVFMGEEVAKGFIKDYAGFRQEALHRQESQKQMARTAANFVLDLAGDGVNPHRAPAMVEEFVKKMLLDLGKQNPVAAEDMFNKETAAGLQEVVRLEAAGLFAEARAKMLEVEKAAPGGGYCGAGGCGIESFDENSQKGREIKEELEAESGETLVKDTERSCKNCSSKGSLYYAYSSTKVKKYCDSCGAKEFKKTPFRAA